MPERNFADLSEVIKYANELKQRKLNKDNEPARESFWSFCKHMDSSFFNDKKIKLHELADILQAAQERKMTKIIINVTVRFGKSYLLTMFCAWLIGKEPTIPIMRITNIDDLFEQFSKDTREIITSRKYRALFPHVELKSNDKSVSRWSTTLAKQVTLFGGGIDGTITGKGAEFCIIDDPVKGIKNGRNDAKMDSIYTVYNMDIVSRFDPNKECVTVILLTRWNRRDLSGRLVKEQGLASLNGSYLDERGQPYTGKWHKFVYPALINGASFDEASYPTRKLLEVRADLINAGEEDGWSLVYQQDVESVDVREKIFLEEELLRFRMKEFNAIKKQYPDVNIRVIVDPADSGTNNIAFVFFVRMNGINYIVDAIYTDKELGTQVTDTAMFLKFSKWQPRRLLHEKDGSGNLFAKLVKAMLAETGISISTKGHSTGNINKITRILSAAGKIKTTCMFLYEDEMDEHYKRFFSDLTAFNKKYPSKDRLDAPDVMAALVTKGVSGTLREAFLQ